MGMRRPKKRLRDGRTIPFAIVEHDYWDDGHVARMSNAEWKIFTTLLRYADGDDRAMPSIAELCAVTDLSRKGVRNSLRGIRRHGYIAQEKPTKRGESCTYIIMPLKSWSMPGGILSTPPEGYSVSHDNLADGQLSIPGMGDSVPQDGLLNAPEVGDSVPPYINKIIERRETAAEGDAAVRAGAAEETNPAADPAVATLALELIDPGTINELRAFRGGDFARAVRDAVASCNIVEANGELEKRRSDYIVAFIRGRWQPLKPKALTQANPETNQAGKLRAQRKLEDEQVRKTLDAERDRQLAELAEIPVGQMPRIREKAIAAQPEGSRRGPTSANPLTNSRLRGAMLEIWRKENSEQVASEER